MKYELARRKYERKPKMPLLPNKNIKETAASMPHLQAYFSGKWMGWHRRTLARKA
jgi:hypothetical protein